MKKLNTCWHEGQNITDHYLRIQSNIFYDLRSFKCTVLWFVASCCLTELCDSYISMNTKACTYLPQHTKSNIPENRNVKYLYQEKLIPHIHAVYSEPRLYEYTLSKKIFLYNSYHTVKMGKTTVHYTTGVSHYLKLALV
jgi:hypothetical protein